MNGCRMMGRCPGCYPGFYPPPGGYFYPPGYFGPDLTYVAPTGLTDEEIANIVRDNINSDPSIPASDKQSIKIDVSGGMVNLSGAVRDRRSKPLAFADAFWSMGVIDVNTDDLKIEELGKKNKITK